MADVKDRLNEVPSWDGSSKTWRRYCKEVGWHLSGTKSSQRKYVAAKLISRLSGAARLLSMSWHQRDFEGEEGVQVMLRRFASSPLVRRSLPNNAAATMSSYFMFQRRPGESIAQFLVRETLGFEEFQEALLQLKEEKDGISPADRLFELPEITTSETDKGERYYNPWHRDQRWRDWEETPFEEQVEQAVDAPEGYTAVPQTSDAGEEAAPHSPAGSPNRTRQTQRSPSRKTEQQRMIDGLGPMDSFILDVLRGWRLLVAASLTNDEWRDILASTGNKLDYPAIAEALQTLWDEQLNHHHGASKGTVLQQHWVETADPWYNAAWHESSWDTEDWHESDWHSMDQFGAWPQAVNDPVDNTATTDDDPELQEALEAEKAAEALAVEARRTWSQAQQATTALRRDRGFGQFAGTSSSKGGKGPIRCHICSGPHFARYCPDRQHPQYRKGGGKQLSPAELDAYLFKGKGKGMRKGKDQMMSSWDDSYMAPWDVMYTQKGKNKNAGKGGKLRSTVNVYGMDYGGMDFSMMELHTLEFHETMEAVPLELYTSNETPAPRAIPEGFGMLDCGATASAGPEASVKKLIAKLRESDPQLKVTIDVERRPFFRYGSGRWGQAMYFASISASTNPNKSFEVFALPNPTEYYQKSFKDYMLVPILVGMDFLTKVGLILDFQDGHAVFGIRRTLSLGGVLWWINSFTLKCCRTLMCTPNGSSTMAPKEIAACRTSLGALQWLAVQSQPLITARCNLLITELSTDPKIQIAQELQEMIRELRKEGSTLKFFKLPGVRRWTDLCVVGLGDQAHNNRPRRVDGRHDSFPVRPRQPSRASQDALKGVPTPMCLVAWRSWKLKRVAIGTNDAEMQAIVETEDVVYRTRLL